MSRSKAGALVCFLSVSAVLAAQDTAYRSDTRTVPVYATVIGADGRLVTGLTRDDFEIFDDGRRQTISLFDANTQPIRVVVLLDMSGSMAGNLTMLRRSAVQMFTQLLPGDLARIGGFGDRIHISPTFTNDVDVLTRALWDLKSGGATPLWAAINSAMTALGQSDGRRVVLVLSDGKNTPGMLGNRSDGPTLLDVVTRAQSQDFMVYAIGMRSCSYVGPDYGSGLTATGSGPAAQGSGPPSNQVPSSRRGTGRPCTSRLSMDEPDPGLREIASETGGGYREIVSTDHLGAAFADVADELHQQYQLGYALPAADGKVHRIEVRVKDASMTARARRSYAAPKESPR